MKVTKKEIHILIIFLGVVVIGLSYFLGVKKLEAKTEALESQNSELRKEEQELEKLWMNQNTYAEATAMMKEYGEAVITVFPAQIRAEDQILYAAKLESLTGSYFSYVNTPVTEYVDIQVQPQENVLTGLTDLTGAIAAHSATDPSHMLDASGMILGCASSNNSFVCTYDQFKELVNYICNDTDIKSIDNITLTYDSNTGNLSGNMTINYFSMLGTGRTYTEPVTSVAGHGVDCIFGSLTGILEEISGEAEGAQQ